MRHYLAWIGFAGIIPLGCTGNYESPETPLNASNISRAENPSEFHDFGAVLTSDQILKHVFTLSNPSHRPVRVQGAEAHVSCCSSVDSLPEWIPPGGTADVEVRLRATRQTEWKRVTFSIHTDDPARPIVSLALQADLLAEAEFLEEGGEELIPGRSGTRRLRITTRRQGERGAGPPGSLEAHDGLAAHWTDPTVESSGPRSIVEWTRTVQVLLPASETVGPRRGALTILCDGGSEIEAVVVWRVVPVLRAAPPRLVLKAGEGDREMDVSLHAADRPIRVLNVSGPVLSHEPILDDDGPARDLRLRLVLGSERAPGRSTITVRTDHPESPELDIPVQILPARPLEEMP